MGIDFHYYPTSNRVPGVYVEMDPSFANTTRTNQRTLLIGQVRPGITLKVGKPMLVESLAQVQRDCGRGAHITLMVQRYLQRDPYGTLYILPLADNPAAVNATATLTAAGVATASGTVNFYWAGTLIQCPVKAGETAAIVAAHLQNAINVVHLDVGIFNTPVPVGSTITLTPANKGLWNNDIDLRFDYLGSAGGEHPVPGITWTIVKMAGGAGNPDITPGLANLSSDPYDFIGLPYTDAGNLTAMRNFLSDDVGRWSWSQMIYGGAFTSYRGTLGTCTSFGLGLNDQHLSVMTYNDSPDPPWIWTTEIVAACATSLRADPGVPLQYIATGLKAPPINSRWTIGERNTLLYSGCSTYRVGQDGTVIIARMVTSYQTNLGGAPDNSYLDVETMYGLMFVSRDLTDYLLTRYTRKKLVSDATVITGGSNAVSARMIKASTIMEYRALEAGGYVQNADQFARSIVVENAGNGLVKILAPVDLVNQLRQIAILLQFRKS